MKKIVVIVLVVVLVLAGVMLVKKRRGDLAKAPLAAILPVVTRTATLKSGQVTLTMPALALAASDLSTTLATKVSGRVLVVYKKEGDRVTKGEKLVDIDASDLVARKAALRAKLEGLDYEITVQRENHQRTMRLFAIKGASLEQSRMEEAAITNLEKGREGLRQSMREIDALSDYSTITAPVAGTIGELLVNAGDMAVPGKPLMRIAADKGLYLSLFLPDSIIPQGILLNGAAIKPVPRNQASANGLIQYVAPLADRATLVEGQYVNVQVVLFQGTGVLVPKDGLLTINGNSYILTMAGGQASRLPVTVLHRGSEGEVIAADFAGQQILVAKPDILLRAAAGVPVHATEEDNGKAPLEKAKEQAGGRTDG